MQARIHDKPALLHFHDRATDRATTLSAIKAGLRQSPKAIDSKYFYDDQGTQLFERITRLPEYYLTRAELDILRRYRVSIATYVGRGAVLLEPGCGNCEKIALLLDTLRPSAYVCWDIAAAPLLQASSRLARLFPWLPCHAFAADYSAGFELPEHLPPGRRVFFFPGSSIGNFEPDAAVALLQRMWERVGPGGGLLIGVDLRKATDVMRRAYNDRQMLTASFNKNCLRHINTLSGGHFSSEAFSHRAEYNDAEQRIEMSLQCAYAHQVEIDGEHFDFAAGERIHTEVAYKHSARSFAELAALAGFRREKIWYDRQHLFSLQYLVADPEPVVLEFDPAVQENFIAPATRRHDEGPYDIPDRRH